MRSERPGVGQEGEFCAHFIEHFLQQLCRSGVSRVCISPGSRSTPLTLAALSIPGLCCSSHLDERSAGFFALGLARRLQQPVALICTSGTAAANYLPAVLEAWYSRVPLILLTADRPPELRDWGAGQTIDQLKLYGHQVKRFVEVTVPGDRDLLRRYARTLASRTVADACSVPAGPVHLNWPLREPFELSENPGMAVAEVIMEAGRALVTEGELPLASTTQRPVQIVVRQGKLHLNEAQIDELRDGLGDHRRGVIVCGSLEPDHALTAAIAKLGRVCGWPILADPLSQLRCGLHLIDAPVIAHADLLLDEPGFADAHAPDLVLQFGDMPVSKIQRQWLASRPIERFIVVDPHQRWPQAEHRLTELLQCDPESLCQSLLDLNSKPDPGPDWLDAFVTADAAVYSALAAALPAVDALVQPRAVWELAALLPENALLYVSNSMPIRDVDAFLPARRAALDLLCNRGVNGIDGVVSSALGAAAAGQSPVVLLIGDLALLHDLGGLLAAHRLALGLTIIVSNNDGGAIFSQLPVAQLGERAAFDDFFTVSHGLDFAAAASQYRLDYDRVTDWAHYRSVVAESLRSAGTQIIELCVDSGANRDHTHEIRRLCHEAVRSSCR